MQDSRSGPTRLVVISARRARSNHAEISRLLGTDIVAGRIAPGHRLPGEQELMRRFGVSRPVLREGIGALVAKGLVVARPRVGTVVRPADSWNMFDPEVLAWHLEAGIGRNFLRDLAELRLALEPCAAALAAQRHGTADLAAMRAALARMDDPVARTPESFAEADFELHRAIGRAAGNAFLPSIGAAIATALRASLQLSAPVGDRGYAAVVAAHATLVDVIAARDSGAAEAAMRAVIRDGLTRHGALEDRA